MTTEPNPHPGEDSIVRDMRARDKALGPGFDNLDVDTADRRILLRMYDQACGELFEALDEVTRLEKGLADTRAKLADHEAEHTLEWATSHPREGGTACRHTHGSEEAARKQLGNTGAGWTLECRFAGQWAPVDPHAALAAAQDDEDRGFHDAMRKRRRGTDGDDA